MTSPDYWYDKWSADSTGNACILRVTNQCNQKCQHCCFRSGPECSGQMSVATCERINAWTPRKIIPNIMGGEFTVLGNYPEMLVALSRGRRRIRLVTNGFWADNDPDKFFEAMRQIKNASCQTIDVAVSNNRWQTLPGTSAIKLLKNSNVEVNLIDTGDLGIDDVVPIGRAWDNGIIPRGNIQCSCESMCNMIITEDGMIGRCPYGYMPWKHFSETTWADAQEYIWGWRSEKLAEGMNCHLCMEIVKASLRGGANPENP